MPNRLGRRWMARLLIPVVRTRNSVMRTSRRIILALMLGAFPASTPGFTFGGAPTNADAPLPVVAAQPGAAAALKRAVSPPTTAAAATTQPSLAPPWLTSLQY